MAGSNGEGESEQVQINFRASRKKKQEWKEQAEEAGFNSFSDFIRVAIESFEEREGRGTDVGMDSGGVTAQPLSELMQKTQSVNNQLETLTDDVQLIKNELADDEEMRELANQLFELLPDEKPGTTPWKEGLDDLHHRIGSDDDRSITLSDKEARNAWEGTLEGLSVALDKPEYIVQKGINRLRNDNLINTAEVDGEKRYWKEI
jgi:hypothetical protein